METNEKVLAPETETPVSKETSSDWTPPTREEYDEAIKATENRTYTRALKELGVNSVKEFRDLRNAVEVKAEELNSLEDIRNKLKSANDELNALRLNNERLSEESILNKLGVGDEYKDDLLTLAKAKVTEEVSLEQSLTELVNGKYRHFVTGTPSPVKVGTDQSPGRIETIDYTPEQLRRYPWLKNK